MIWMGNVFWGLILEKANKVGGLARTEVYKGYSRDIGGHRFVTKFKEAQDLWQTIRADDFRDVRSPYNYFRLPLGRRSLNEGERLADKATPRLIPLPL